MKHIIKTLHKRGLHITATNLEREIKISDIDMTAIINNRPKIIAFANKLSATGDPKLKAHAKTILNIIDNAK